MKGRRRAASVAFAETTMTNRYTEACAMQDRLQLFARAFSGEDMADENSTTIDIPISIKIEHNESLGYFVYMRLGEQTRGNDNYGYLHSDGVWRRTQVSRQGLTGWFESQEGIDVALQRWFAKMPHVRSTTTHRY